MDSSDQKVHLPEADAPELLYNNATSEVRPPIEYSSVSAFLGSSVRRFKSLWTRRFTLSLLAGQLVSLCITCTNVTTTELVNR
jgi:solute carrier family 35 protein F1/2